MKMRVVAGVAGAAVATAGGVAVAATAAAPSQITVASTHLGDAPRVFVDSKGTVNVAWIADDANGYTTLGYARKPAGAKKFTRVSLPGQAKSGVDAPLIYEPSPGVLEVIADVTRKVYGWRSTDDGASWTSLNADAINALEPSGVYIDAERLVAEPGGPIVYAGNEGDTSGQVVQLKDDLSGVTDIATNTAGLSGVQVTRAAGALFLIGVSDTTSAAPFSVGSASGTVAFPTCAKATGIAGTVTVAAGPTGAVVAATDCGKVWTRTITPDGSVGKLVTVGSAPAFEPWVQLSSRAGSGLTAAYLAPGGDIDVAHSSDGSHWSTAPGALAVASEASSASGVHAALSTGVPSWVGDTGETGNDLYAVRAIATTSTYRTPRAPSSAGISHPVHGVLGSLAVTVPGALAHASFDRTGKVVVRLLGAISDHLTANITVERKEHGVDDDVCLGTSRATVSAGRVRTLTLVCRGGGVVIGGQAAGGVAAKRGDLVTLTFAGRNGTLTLSSHVG